MLRSSRSSVLVFASLALLLVCGAAFGQLAKPAVKPYVLDSGPAVTLADGVVVDTERQVAYVMAPESGIEALDLAGGSLVWTADSAARPLIVAGGLLVAQAEASEAGRLDLVSFDVRDGRPAGLSARIDLPESVTARLYDAPKSSFRVEAGFLGDRLVLSWHLTKLGGGELQGYLPSEEEAMVPGPKAFERLEGTVELDLASGTVRPFDKAVRIPRPLDVLPAGQAKGLGGRLFTSADGRHLLRSARSTEGEVWQSWRWEIFSRRTGELVGSFDHFTSSAPFVVVGSRLIFVSQPFFQRQGDEIVDVPRKVRAIDLASGAELWTQEASDPDFRGPFPP